MVILTTNGSEEVFLRAVNSGAVGYLLKDAHPAQIVQAVRAAASGGAVLDPRLAGCLLREVQRQPLSLVPPLPCALTAREVAILRLVAEGYTNKEIGRHLQAGGKDDPQCAARPVSEIGADIAGAGRGAGRAIQADRPAATRHGSWDSPVTSGLVLPGS